MASPWPVLAVPNGSNAVKWATLESAGPRTELGHCQAGTLTVLAVPKPPSSTETMSRFMATHLQPYASEPATACHGACNRMAWSL
eukprot:scaffold14911_cov36-Phaeocystis_antarctica.AAC.2